MAEEDIRMKVWRLMEEKGIANFPKTVLLRIPNFFGAKKAAKNLRKLAEFKATKTIFCNTDSPQRPVGKWPYEVVRLSWPRLRQKRDSFC